MAKIMTCDGCGKVEAVLMVTQIGTGDIQAFCPGCVIVWAEGIAAALRTTLGLPDADTEAEQDADTIPAREVGDVGPRDPGSVAELLADRQQSDTTHDPTSTAGPPAGATMGAGQPAPASSTQEG